MTKGRPPLIIKVGEGQAWLPFAGWDESVLIPEVEQFIRHATTAGIRTQVKIEAPDDETRDRLLAYFCDLYGELISDGIPDLKENP